MKAADISKIPIPAAMANRPRDIRGYPIPYFQYIPITYATDRKIDFRVTDPSRRLDCLRNNKCGLCGLPLMPVVYFIGGPLSAKSGVYSDPPLHYKCAEFAIAVCPYLAMPNYKVFVSEQPKEGVIEDAMAAVDRPEQMYLMKAAGFEMTQIKNEKGEVHPMVYALATDPQIVRTF